MVGDDDDRTGNPTGDANRDRVQGTVEVTHRAWELDDPAGDVVGHAAVQRGECERLILAQAGPRKRRIPQPGVCGSDEEETVGARVQPRLPSRLAWRRY